MDIKLEELRLRLSQIFEQRDNTFPYRDPQNTQAMREAVTAYANGLRSVQEPNWQPDKILVESIKSIVENGVFICGYMKSGTTLLVELLDNHPELVVIPGDSHLVDWIKNPLIVYNKISDQGRTPYSEERLRGWDTFAVLRFISPTGQKPFWVLGENNKPYLDLLNYLDYWLEYLPPSDRRPFLAVVLAFYCANPQRPSCPKLWIEKTPGNEKHVDYLLKLFPSARFIHIIRDPRSNLSSLKRFYKVRGWRWQIENVAAQLRKSIETGLLHQIHLGKKRYHLLYYEDLVTQPETEMEKVAHFLSIRMDQALLTPTTNSLPAKPNSMYDEANRYGEVLPILRDNWQDELDSLEYEKMLAILYRTTRRVGYQWDDVVFYPAYFRYILSKILKRIRR